MIRAEHPVLGGQGRVSAVFIGKDEPYAADTFTGQYDILLQKNRDIQSLAYLEQVHGDAAMKITGPAPGLNFAGEGDALWTREEGIALLIRTADCLPILFYSKSEPLVGAVHAGWRGLEKRILSRVLKEVHCGDLDFFVGPFIGGSSYEVGSDVAGHFDGGCSKENGNGKFLLDLRAVLEGELKAAGIDRSRVTWYADDTLNSGWWYSARGGDQKRNLALIWRAPR